MIFFSMLIIFFFHYDISLLSLLMPLSSPLLLSDILSLWCFDYFAFFVSPPLIFFFFAASFIIRFSLLPFSCISLIMPPVTRLSFFADAIFAFAAFFSRLRFAFIFRHWLRFDYFLSIFAFLSHDTIIFFSRFLSLIFFDFFFVSRLIFRHAYFHYFHFCFADIFFAIYYFHYWYATLFFFHWFSFAAFIFAFRYYASLCQLFDDYDAAAFAFAYYFSLLFVIFLLWCLFIYFASPPYWSFFFHIFAFIFAFSYFLWCCFSFISLRHAAFFPFLLSRFSSSRPIIIIYYLLICLFMPLFSLSIVAVIFALRFWRFRCCYCQLFFDCQMLLWFLIFMLLLFIIISFHYFLLFISIAAAYCRQLRAFRAFHASFFFILLFHYFHTLLDSALIILLFFRLLRFFHYVSMLAAAIFSPPLILCCYAIIFSRDLLSCLPPLIFRFLSLLTLLLPPPFDFDIFRYFAMLSPMPPLYYFCFFIFLLSFDVFFFAFAAITPPFR